MSRTASLTTVVVI